MFYSGRLTRKNRFAPEYFLKKFHQDGSSLASKPPPRHLLHLVAAAMDELRELCRGRILGRTESIPLRVEDIERVREGIEMLPPSERSVCGMQKDITARYHNQSRYFQMTNFSLGEVRC